MRNKITFVMLFLSIVVFSQNKLFQNNIGENSLSYEQKIHKDLASTYLSTKYYSQSSFELMSDHTIILPDSREIKALYLKSFRYSNGSESSVYNVENEPNSELVFSKAGDAITGMYVSATGKKIIFHQLDTNLFAVSIVNEESLIQKDSKTDFVIDDHSVSQKQMLTSALIPHRSVHPLL